MEENLVNRNVNIANAQFSVSQYQFPIVGQVCLFPYNFMPDGWVNSDGRYLSTNGYSDLYSVMGSMFGGDETMYRVPNMVGQSPMNEGAYYICTNGVTKYNMPNYGGVLGEVMLFVDSAVPNEYFKLCDGQSLPISENEELYSIIANMFGGNGQYFNLPNMMNQYPMMGVSYYMCTNGEYPQENYGTIDSTMYLGALHLYPKNAKALASSGIANGQVLPTYYNQNLFRLYGYTFGGNGSSTFALPNITNNAPLDKLLYMVQMEGNLPRIGYS